VISETYYTRFYHSEGREGSDNTLSLFISPRSFQFALFDQNRKTIRELCHIDLPAGAPTFLSDAAQLEFLFNNYRLLNSRFERVFISVLHPDFALVPAVFAENVNQKRLLAFTGADNGPASGSRHRLGDIDFCYTLSLSVQQLLERSFPNAMMRHGGAVSISLLMSHAALSASNVFLNVHEGTIELLARRNKQLLFYNVFTVETNEDILYYLLFMAEQFELSAKEIVIAVGGIISEDLLTLIKKFTGDLHLALDANPFPFTGKFSGVSPHHYFTLINQHLCEL
jgi:hypothetical protein